MRLRAASLLVAVVAPVSLLGAVAIARVPAAFASTASCSGRAVDVGAARGTVSIRPWWHSRSGVFFDGEPLDLLGSDDSTCSVVTLTDEVANAALTLVVPSETQVTLGQSSVAEVEVGGVTYVFSTGPFSTIESGGSSALVVAGGVSLTAAAGPSGIAVGGTLFGQGFSEVRGNGPATRLTLAGPQALDLASTPGSASFGALSLIDVTGGFTGTSATAVDLPSTGASQLSVANGAVTVTVGSTAVPFAGFGTYGAQGSAPTSFVSDGSVAVDLVGNGGASSLTFRGPGPGVVSYESASSGTATSSFGAATIITTFSRMGHVTSTWQTAPPHPLVTSGTAPSVAAIPSAPTGVVATVPNAATHQALVSWDEPASSGAAVTSWTVVPLDRTSGRSGPAIEVNGLANSVTVRGLVAGDAYAFEVTATNAAGTGSPSAPSNPVVPLGVSAKKRSTAVSDSAGGVASSAISSSGPNKPSLAVHGFGRGSVTLGDYPSDPLSQAGASRIAKAGTTVQAFFDVSIAPSSEFRSLKFTVCNMSAGQQIMWWNPAAQTLSPVSQQSAISGTAMCATAGITDSTRPDLADLFGTVFALATPKAYADATSPGSFWVLSFNGQVKRFGKAKTYGSVAWRQAGELEPFVAISPSIDAKGYLVVSRSGAVLAFGDAKSYGSLANLHLQDSSRIQIISITRTEDAKGYWLTSSDGNVFAFGDAKFYGSPAAPLRSDSSTTISAMARTPDGLGYWLVTNTGEVFAFGDAQDLGSALHANGIVGIASPQTAKGYLLVSSTGVVYPFGNVHRYGPSRRIPSSPVIGITSTADGKGYYLVTATGAVIPCGDARAKDTAPVSTYRISAIATP